MSRKTLNMLEKVKNENILKILYTSLLLENLFTFCTLRCHLAVRRTVFLINATAHLLNLHAKWKKPDSKDCETVRSVHVVLEMRSYRKIT